jgi:hypothetical protein
MNGIDSEKNMGFKKAKIGIGCIIIVVNYGA